MFEYSKWKEKRIYIFFGVSFISGLLPFLHDILEDYVSYNLFWIDCVGITLFTVTSVWNVICDIQEKKVSDTLLKEKRSAEITPFVLNQFATIDDSKADDVIRQSYCSTGRYVPFDYTLMKSTYDINTTLQQTVGCLRYCVSQMTGIPVNNISISFLYRFPYEIDGYDKYATWKTMNKEIRIADWNHFSAGTTYTNSVLFELLGSNDAFFYTVMTIEHDHLLIVNDFTQIRNNKIMYKEMSIDPQPGSICGLHISLLPQNDLKCDKPIVEAILTINTSDGNLLYDPNRPLLITTYNDENDFKNSFHNCVIRPYVQRFRSLLADKYISHRLAYNYPTTCPETHDDDSTEGGIK